MMSSQVSPSHCSCLMEMVLLTPPPPLLGSLGRRLLSHTEFNALGPELTEDPGVAPASLLRFQPVPPTCLSLREAALGGRIRVRPSIPDPADSALMKRQSSRPASLINLRCDLRISSWNKKCFSLAKAPRVLALSSEGGQVPSMNEAGRVWFIIQTHFVCRLNT